MVIKMLFRKMLRDMNEHKMQFIAIFLMSFLTLWIFTGVGSEVAGIQQTVDEYYDNTNMADIWIYSEKIDNNTLNNITEIKSTKQTERQLVVSSTADLNNDPTVKLHFLENNTISKYYPIKGKDIDINDKEGIWLDKRFADAKNLKINDKIKLEFEGKTIEKTIKGLGYSPEYVYAQGDSLIPDFDMNGFGYLSYKALDTPEIPYNVVLIKTNDNSEDYQEKLDEKIEYDIIIPFKDHSSVSQFQSEIDQHSMMGSIFPIVFVAVALLTLLTTMTRIVNHQRTQIGTLKALGFSDKKITLHYISYGFYLTLLGVILGLIIGPTTMPYLFFPSMSAFYTLPEWKSGINISFFIVAITMVLLSVLFTYLAAKNISKESPAQILVPKAPKISKKGLIEKTRIWKKVGFNGRWNYRDIRRNKIRSLVTIISIIGCTLLLISAFGMNDGMNDLKTWQYGGINHYESQLVLEDNITQSQINKLTSDYNATQVMNQKIEVRSNNVKKTTNIMVYNKTDLITPTDKNMESINLPSDGVSLTEKSAELLGVKKGDTIEWHLYGEDKWINSTIDDIYADPATQGITISQDKLESYDYNFTPTYLVTKEKVNSPVDGVSSVNTFSDLQDSWDELMASANLLIGILLIFAFALSVVMLYSLGILAFTEVERDLATLKVIGFKTKAIRRLFLVQNLILSIIGFVFGIPLGYYVLRIMMDSSGDTFYYPINYSLTTISITFIIVIGLSFVVNLLFSRKIKSINMVESLKKARD